MITFDKEGETPLDDVSGLKIKGITTRAQLDAAEADNILDAYLKYTTSSEHIKNIKFDTVFLQQLHKDMLGKVWSWAGEFRTTQTSIGIDPTSIRTALYHLMDDLSYWETKWDYKDTAVRLHHTLVKIHPFLNGNGRCARLFTDMWLLSKSKEMLDWGSDAIDNENQTMVGYISSLREADNGNYEPLKNFMFPVS